MIRVLVVLLFLSSCGAKIRNFDSYQKTLLPSSSFLPSKEDLNQPIPKVVVFPFEEGGNEVAKQANLGNSMATNIEKILGRNKLAIVIDRKIAKKLEKEISLIEASSSVSYEGPKIADYAVSGDISNATFSSSYVAAQTKYNYQTKTYHTIPARYNYYSEVSGNVKIYDLPNFNNIKTIKFSRSASDSENVRSDNSLSFGFISFSGSGSQARQRDDGLVRKAGDVAITKISADIMNHFAKIGYILEKRSLKNKVIFKINLGSKEGVKYKDKLMIYGKYETENPITKESEVETRIIGEAVVSDQINPDNSWIIVRNGDLVDKIRLGDQIKIKYKAQLFDMHDVGKALDLTGSILQTL